jgi:hypothetical protein
VDEAEVETLVVAAAAGDEHAWQKLWVAIEPLLSRIVAQPRFLGRLGRNEDDRGNIVLKARLVQRATRTDAEGRFVVGQLELGELEYRVSASDGVHRTEARATASREGDEPLELELR